MGSSILAVSIFALTWLLVATRSLKFLPIGRSSGALTGAVLMVAAGVLTPEGAYAAIDHDTLALLLGMMILTAYLERAGIFERIAEGAIQNSRSGFALLAGLSAVSAILSAILVNDTVCLFFTPAVVSACRRAKLPMGPYLIALATSANLGSAATLVGNPQNMILGALTGIPFFDFLVLAGPAALAGWAVNLALLGAYYARSLPGALAVPPAEVRPPVDPPGPVLAVLALVVVGFFLGLHLGFTALAGATAMIAWGRRDPSDVLARVDWALLLFFSGLFVTVGGLDATGLVDQAWAAAVPTFHLSEPGGVAAFSGFVLLGSNLVSNVPLVMLIAPSLDVLGGGDSGRALLGFAATAAGNLTLVGSVANLIVAEGAREHYTLGFWEYARFGVPSTLLALAVGAVVITALY